MAVQTPVRQYVPQPEPDLTPDKMIARAVAMRDMLRADQEEADKRGFYSEELHEAFKKAGFYRMLQPKMFGGYEFGLDAYYKQSVEIGRGGSAGIAWCLNLAHHHSLIIASFWPEKAQREIFGKDGHFVSGARAGGAGTARKVEGGYIVNGRFRYSSGSPYSTHHIVHVKIDGPGYEDGPPEGTVCWAVVPRDQYQIMYDWGNMNDLGLQGSGSNTVEMHDAFVPKDWIVIDHFRDVAFEDATAVEVVEWHALPGRLFALFDDCVRQWRLNRGQRSSERVTVWQVRPWPQVRWQVAVVDAHAQVPQCLADTLQLGQLALGSVQRA